MTILLVALANVFASTSWLVGPEVSSGVVVHRFDVCGFGLCRRDMGVGWIQWRLGIWVEFPEVSRRVNRSSVPAALWKFQVIH